MEKYIRSFSRDMFFTKGFFIVAGSNLIKTGQSYRVGVFSNDCKKEELLVRIKSNNDKNLSTEFQKVTLNGNDSHTIDFDLKNSTEGDFSLEVKCGRFEESRALHMNLKKHSAFVQTDKSVYKPSDNIQFRVLVLDGNTRPIDASNVQIFITDGADNRIKQYDHPRFNMGVFQNELLLSDLPVMGNWKIHVKVNDEEETIKVFEVAEYVLPKFEVLIDTNNDIHYNYGNIRATIRAQYTFGKVAKGTATITAEVSTQYSGFSRAYTRQQSSRKVSRTLQVDGKNFVEFNLERDFGIRNNDYDRLVHIEAQFKEELSGKEVNASTDVRVHKTEHNLDLIKSNEKFKPGLPYSITAIVKNHDKNTPVTDSFNPVKFHLVFYYDELRTYKETFETHIGSRRVKPYEEYEAYEEKTEYRDMEILPENGIAKLNLDLKKEYTHFDIKAKYMETEKSLSNIKKVETECNQYIMAKVLTDTPTLSKNVSVEILSTKEISKLSYQVLGRGSCVESKTVYFTATTRHVFEFKPHLLMLPKAQLIVAYLHSDGEIISDRIEIGFVNELINQIDVKLSSDQVKPGSDIDISVTTRINSFVGLLGVDQSVLLMKKGNDIEASTVFQELAKYGTIEKNNYSYISSDKRYLDFFDSNAIIITNAKKPYERKVQRRAHSSSRHYSSNSNFSLSLSSRSRKMFRNDDDDEMCLRNVSRKPEPKFQKEVSMDEDDSEEESDDRSGAVVIPKKPIEIRKTFPETWLWDNLEFKDGTTTKTISKKVPDTITSWVITAFSIDQVTGLGLTKQPSKFNVFQPFFVSTNLPYSIKRGEVVSIPVIVFNYMNTDQKSDITLFNDDNEFEFIDTEISDRKLEQSKRSKTTTIKANDGSTVSFMIRPTKVGNITIKVIAETMTAGDGVERQLKVEPEGIAQFLNEAIFIDLRSKSDFSTVFDIPVPANAVPDSTHIEVSAIGDVLGPSIDNLDKLIKLPYGCGEQNMLNFVPNIVVLAYLTIVGKLTPTIEARTKKYMETGYQKELTYKHDDGSYSAFGKHDRSGSTWLTAFVAKSFHQASKYIRVDQNMIKQALNFLSKIQLKDGSFPEVGYVSHKDMQGGSSKGIALTAYTLITFMENENHHTTYKSTINKAIDYIVKHQYELDDTYSLALATYALILAKHEKKNSFMEKLDEKAEKVDGLTYWKKAVPESESKNIWNFRPNAVNIEMTAYTLLAYIEAGREVDGISIMKWLVTQRNKNGGFQSTQDTVVGLQALSKLAANIYDSKSSVEISVSPKSSPPIAINVNSANAMILQKFDLPSSSRHFEVSAKGRGFSIFQISYRYNLDDAGKCPRFNLTPVIEKSSNKEFLHLSVGTTFVPDVQADKSNMAVMEVTLPSGFTFDSDHLADLLASPRVKKVETKDGDTVVIVYFDDIDTKEIRPQIKAYRTHKVAKQKPSPVVIYDYYDNSRRATTFYSPPEISIHDITDY